MNDILDDSSDDFTDERKNLIDASKYLALA